ncbi:hypothetical protein IKT64_01195 [Candidatus Saccharibacteria bacterium]|nr:hypothetical protein [Candidatus Saccharibacteria bacterium]
MKRKLFLIFILGLLAYQFFDTEPTIAATDQCLKDAVHGFDMDPEEIKSEMPTIEKACDVCHETFGGALWINGYAGNTPDEVGMYSSTSEIVVDGDSSATATLYLHGQIYACGLNIDANNSGDYDAHYIYITKNPHSGASASTLQADVVGYVDNQSSLGSAEASVDRVLESVTSGMANRWTKPKTAQPIVINLQKYKEVADLGPAYRRTINGKMYVFEQWEHTVNVYRCPVSTTNIASDGCWSDESQINLTIRKEIPPTTCSGKHQNDSDYSQSATIPSWFLDNNVTTYSYNKCSGTSILGTRLRVNNSTKAVRRSTGTNEGADTIYVKPGDQVAFDHMFLSAAQPVTKTIIDEGYTSVWTGRPASNWENYHHITASVKSGSDTAGSYSWTDSKPIGTADNYTLTVNYNFERGHTNGPSGSGTSYTVNTGNLVTMTNDGSRTNLGSATIGDLKVEGVTGVSGTVSSATLNVVAPYNFANKVTVKWAAAADRDSRVFAGDVVSGIGGTYTTEAVKNSKNNETYATVSPESKLRLYTYYSNSNETGTTIGGNSVVSSFDCSSRGCEEAYAANDQKLNSSEKANGDSGDFPSRSIQVADTNAGRWLCAVATVYPATSGDGGNYTDKQGSHTWYVSPSKCVQIAKKPTFQVWNGNLYANGSVQTNVSKKSEVSGHSEITTSDPRAFGSWVEHGLIVRGTNNDLASGAVFGYQTNSNTNLSNNPGGHAEGTAPAVCKRSPLTLANSSCVNHPGVTTNGNSGVVVTETVNFDDYKSTAAQATSLATNTNIALSSSDKYKDVSGIRYFYNSSAAGKLYLSADTIPAGANYVVYSKGSVYITGNLTYENDDYSVPSEVPQLIIITDGSIFIDGNATQVDAWLVAKSTESGKGLIKTCSTSEGVSQSEAECSKQLRINGPIIAKKLELTRVYGAATGNNSATPAEIINLSPATYVFSQSKATDGATLRTVYSKEVAPRW